MMSARAIVTATASSRFVRSQLLRDPKSGVSYQVTSAGASTRDDFAQDIQTISVNSNTGTTAVEPSRRYPVIDRARRVRRQNGM